MITLLRTHPYWLLCLLFIIASSCYWFIFATDRYVSETHIILDSPQVQTQGFNLASLVSGSAGGKDLLLLRDHMLSVDMLNTLDAQLDLRHHYSQPWIDRLSRLAAADVPMETFHRYYQRRVEVRYDEYATVLRVRVQAYDTTMAQVIAQRLLVEGERHMNAMGRRLAEEQVQFIAEQVDELEARFFASREAVLAFQNEHGLVSPTSTVLSRSEVIARLEGELAVLNARQTALADSRSPQSAERIELDSEIRAIAQQIERERERLTTREGMALNRISAEFETLELRAQFALELYSTALAALESTRIDAIRTLKQVSLLQEPTLPEYAQEPRRLYNTTLYGVIAILITLIIHLFMAIVRDHQD